MAKKSKTVTMSEQLKRQDPMQQTLVDKFKRNIMEECLKTCIGNSQASHNLPEDAKAAPSLKKSNQNQE